MCDLNHDYLITNIGRIEIDHPAQDTLLMFIQEIQILKQNQTYTIILFFKYSDWLFVVSNLHNYHEVVIIPMVVLILTVIAWFSLISQSISNHFFMKNIFLILCLLHKKVMYIE